jgi:hypothetical protein
LTRLQVLKKLAANLESFLERAAEAEKGPFDVLTRIDSLDDIARDSLRGKYITNRLGNWFARNKDLPQSRLASDTDLTSIANILGEIKGGLDTTDPESRKLSEEIDHWREKGVVPKRKLILKLKPESDEQNMVKEFTDLLSSEYKYVGSGEFEGRHLLSVLDDVLKSADAKENPMFLHLAGSIIYYLKAKGYKIGPFARRLKEIEREKSSAADVD